MVVAMYVLHRKKNEKILIPDLGIELIVLKAQRGRSTVGIISPKGTRIVRGEECGKHSEINTEPSSDSNG
jgi:sRNA-binding carbon storage regulator CsrA